MAFLERLARTKARTRLDAIATRSLGRVWILKIMNQTKTKCPTTWRVHHDLNHSSFERIVWLINRDLCTISTTVWWRDLEHVALPLTCFISGRNNRGVQPTREKPVRHLLHPVAANSKIQLQRMGWFQGSIWIIVLVCASQCLWVQSKIHVAFDNSHYCIDHHWPILTPETTAQM